MAEARKKTLDQRAAARVPLVLSATVSVPDKALAVPCVLIDLSTTGAGIQYEDAQLDAGLTAILDIANFGRFNGVTVRHSGQTRGFKFAEDEAQRQRLKEKLIAFVARGIAGVAVERRKQPRAPGNTDLILTLPSGISETCEVLDISLEGVSLITQSRPPIGHLLRVGHSYARVVSHRKDGIGMKFINFIGV
jgi:hypothetical protein